MRDSTARAVARASGRMVGSSTLRTTRRAVIGMIRGGVPSAEKGNYETLRWGHLLDLVFKLGGETTRDVMATMVARSAWQYVYPSQGQFFRAGEFALRLADYHEQSRVFVEQQLVGHVRSDDRVLDFGCGIGVVGEYVAPHCREYLGVDVSRGAIRAAQHWHRNDPDMSFELSNGFDLSGLADTCVSFVYTHHVIEHIDEIHALAIFREFERVLIPGGRAWIHVAALDLEKGLNDFVNQAAKLRWLPANKLPIWRMRYYTEPQLIEMLRVAGLNVTEISHDQAADGHYVLAVKPAF